MTSYKRMKQAPDTKAVLLDTASQLFAQQGFKGASVRAITSAARANLGAVTYHYGSKHALYNAVLQRATAPLRERLATAVSKGAAPLDRLESAVRAFFDHLAENPNLPRLMIQQLVTAKVLPAPIKDAMQANIGAFVSCIEAGQRDGSIRSGNPLFLALSIGSQPIFLSIARRALKQSVGVDQDDAKVRRELVDSVIRFVRAGLAADSGTGSSEVL
jgi:AcrR family transcriptional regulator